MNLSLHIAIVGYGNVGSGLADALINAGFENVIIVTSKSKNLTIRGKRVPCIEQLSEDSDIDLALICVPDDALENVAQYAGSKVKYVAHTSGSVPLTKGSNQGVFYPFQTFTKGRSLNWAEIPICIESSNPELLQLLNFIGGRLSSTVREMDSGNRKRLHLVGVFAANFNNHLRYIIDELLEDANVTSAFGKPLMEEIERKAEELTPLLAQTGPAIRGDQSTIDAHLQMLQERPHWRDLYLAFTQSIQSTKE